jgi:hypothetical protein
LVRGHADGVAAGKLVDRTLEDGHGAQGDDEGVDLPLGHEKAVEKTDQGASQESHGDSPGETQVGLEPHRQDSGEGDHGSYREVHMAADHEDSESDRHHRVERHRVQDGREVEYGEEPGRE